MHNARLTTTYIYMSALTRVFIVCALLMALCGGAIFNTTKAEAAFNAEINYQGKLTNSSNAAVADGEYDIEFNLYTVASGGVAIWTETQTVHATSGLFSVMLGDISSLSGVDFNQTLYLGVTIEADSEMAPRKVLGAVPAAFQAQELDGFTASQFLRSDEPDTMASTSASTLLTVTQSGTGNILDLKDGATTIFTAKDGGHIGIGTTTTSGARLTVQTSGTTDILNLLETGGTEVFTVLESGNVGVGTTSPIAKLSVKGGGTSTGINFQTTNSNNGALFSIFDNGLVGVGTTNGAIASKLATQSSALSTSGLYTTLASGVSGGEWNALNIQALDNAGSSYANSIAWNFTSITGATGPAISAYRTGAADTDLTFSVTKSDARLELIRLDGSSGNVGIGTTSPLTKLSVQGNSRITGDLSVAGLTATSTVTFSNLTSGLLYANGSGVLSASSSISSSIIEDAYVRNTGDSISGNLTFSGTSANIVLGSNWISGDGGDEGLYVASNGNVGVGTSSPSEKLQVAGNIKIGTHESVGNAILAPYTLGGLIVKPQYNINDSTSAVFEVQAYNSTPLATFKESGNVGFGTTSPAWELHVDKTQDKGTYLNLTNFSSGTTAQAGVYGRTDTASYLAIAHGSGRVTSRYGFAIGGYAEMLALTGSGLLIGTGANATPIVFGTNSTERMRILSDGNVGIGTSSPLTKLSVQGNSRITGNLSVAGLTATSTITFSSLTDGLLYANSSGELSSTSTLALSLIPDKFLRNDADDSTTGALTVGGNLNADAGIDVAGGDITAATGVQLDFTDEIADKIYYYNTNYGVGISSGDLATWSGGFHSWRSTSRTGTEWMRLTATGLLGIGTTTPTSKLTVAGSSATGGILVNDTSTTSASPVVEVRGRRLDGNTSQSFGGGLALAGLNTTGAVGLGKKLGTVYFGGNHTSGDSANLLYSASISGVSTDTFDSSSDMPTGLAFFTGSNGYALGTANQDFGVERMRITEAGDVGIGTTSPLTKLSVQGSSRITGDLSVAGITATSTVTGLRFIASSATATSTLPVLSVTGRLYDASGKGGTSGMVLQSTGTGINWVATSTLGITAGGAGDITAVGDCTTGACFDGTSGTTLTFNNAGGDKTLVFDGSNFTFNDGLIVDTLDTGQGANELYDMDQNVLTTSDVTFNSLTLTTDLSVANGGTGASTLTGLLLGNGTSPFTATTSLSSSYIEDAYVRNTGDSISGNLTFSGSSANILLGSNWLSGDGADEGVFVGSTGNVGVGTSTPSHKLSVYGDILSQEGAFVLGRDEFSGRARMSFKEEGGGSAQWDVNLDSNDAIDNAGEASARMQLTTGYNGQNDNPAFLLQFNETMGNWATNYNVFSVTKDNTYIRSNLGIGTTSPLTKLSVQGNSRITGNLSVAGLTATSTVTFGALTDALIVTNSSGVLAEYAGTSCTGQFIQSLSALGVASCASAGGSIATSTALANTQIVYGTGVGTVGSEAAFTYDASTNTLSVDVLTLSGTGTLNGVDVIDGTTESTIEAAIDTLANLTAASSLATVGTITSGVWNGTDIAVSDGGTGASTLTGLLQGNGTGAITGITGTAGQVPYYNGTNTLLATSSIFIASNRNIGIGTTSPSLLFGAHGLMVYGGSTHGAIMVDASGSNSSMISMAKNGSSVWHFERNYLDDSFRITESGVDYRMTLLKGGNIGIGTTTSTAKLTILDASNPQLQLSQNSSLYTRMQVAASTGDMTLSLSTGQDIYMTQPGGSTGANLWVCEGDTCPSVTLTDGGNIVAEGAYYFSNGYYMKEASSTAVGLYDDAGDAIILFDDGT